MLNELAVEVHRTAVDKGWWGDLADYTYDGPQRNGRPVRSFGEIIALIHSEASEALEEYRAGHAYTETYYSAGWLSTDRLTVRKPEGIPTEMADIIIRVLDFCANAGIDIDKAVEEKMIFNETRPARHGGKRI